MRRCSTRASEGATPELVAAALKEWRPVSTSRPTPAALLEVYERAAEDGATEIVSIHLSGDMSGTFESAQLAARDASVPVVAVDSRQVGVATGYAALGGGGRHRCGRVRGGGRRGGPARAAASSSLFYVDTLEYLRRGGRIGAAAALFGGALAVKPLLKIEDGKVARLERVRTSGRALARLEELAVEAAGETAVDVCVAHLASPDRAAQLTESLGDRLERQPGGPRRLVRRARRRARSARRPGHARGLRRAPHPSEGSRIRPHPCRDGGCPQGVGARLPASPALPSVPCVRDGPVPSTGRR